MLFATCYEKLCATSTIFNKQIFYSFYFISITCLCFSYKLSRSLQPTRIRSTVKVNDGRTHKVSFHRNRGSATLTVGSNVVSGQHSSSYLAASGDIYLGMLRPRTPPHPRTPPPPRSDYSITYVLEFLDSLRAGLPYFIK